NRTLIYILLFAALVRIVYLLFYSSMPDWYLLTVDNYYHVNWAEDIVSGNIWGDTTYFRAPFYVYCLAILFYVFGIALWAPRIFGLFIGIASIFLTFRISSRLFNQRTAIIASLIQAVFPVVLYFESELLLDALFMFFLELSFYLYLIWNDDKTAKNGLLLGISLGLAAITRPIILVFAIPILLVVLIKKEKSLSKFKQLAFLAIGGGLIILPITVRNIVVGHEPVLIAAQGGINFYIGNNSNSDGLSAVMPEPLGRNWQNSDITYIAEKDIGLKLKPGEVSSYWFKRGLAEITDNPLKMSALFLKKVYFNFSNREVSNNRNLPEFFNRHPLLKFNPFSFGLIFSLAIVAVFTGWSAHNGIRTITILIVIYVIVVSVFFYNSRFRLPVIPFYIILGTVGFETLFFETRKGIRTLLPLLGLVMAAALFSFVPWVSLPVGQSTQYWNLLALNHYIRNNFVQALPLFRNAVLADSTESNANLNLGACFLKLGQTDSALYYFEREKRFNPLRPSSYTNIASIYLISNKPKEAFDEATRALALKPYNDMSHQILLRAAGELTDSISVDSLYRLTLNALNNSTYPLAAANYSATTLSRRNAREKAKEILARAA
ncbi:MAG TPA: glycosyltransferase family 39 protein, partial [candidate division Zixibacteria bacterium]|nr:glycosyltransferase family 39 protein [candidate division Zixibacteria bacterium]